MPFWKKIQQAGKYEVTFFSCISMLQSVVTRLQMNETVFKKQLSAAETLFFQDETPILLHIGICAVWLLSEYAWNMRKTEWLLHFPECLLPVFYELDRSLCLPVMLVGII